MKAFFCSFVAGFVLGTICAPVMSQGPSASTSTSASTPTSASSPPKSQSYQFRYAATLTGVPAGSKVRVWFPIAESNSDQVVEMTAIDVPKRLEFHRDTTYGNRIAYFQIRSTGAPIPFAVEYQVDRREATARPSKDGLSEEEKKIFLQANSRVPIAGAPVRLLDGMTLPKDRLVAGRILYDLVEKHMKYDKSLPGYGQGDAVWACDSRTGNCTDFHSLFISLARSQSIPARFEIGFPLGGSTGKVGGYHCWAWFYAGPQGWVPVDISEADKHPDRKEYFFGHLPPDRIAFSSGRDIRLVPASAVPSKNYFIYPHVEVDGKVWPREKIVLDFSYHRKPSEKIQKVKQDVLSE